MATENHVFISYSHADEAWLKRLRVHLTPLQREGVISFWDDSRIKPGSQWRDEIREALLQAKVAVLLISADFLASDFISTNELPPLLAAAEKRGTVILPVIVSPCRFGQTPALAGFQAVNPPEEPLVRMRKAKRETLFVRVATLIEEAFTSVPQQLQSVPDRAWPQHGDQTTVSHPVLSEHGTVSAHDLAQSSEDDLMMYVVAQIESKNAAVAPGTSLSLNPLFQSTSDNGITQRLYALVHGCVRNGWLRWSGADQARQVTLTPEGADYANYLSSVQPRRSAQVMETPRVIRPDLRVSTEDNLHRNGGVRSRRDQLRGLGANEQPLRIFCSYAPRDEKLYKELRMHLNLLQRREPGDFFYDLDINTGNEWRQRSDNLEAADVVLMLISAYYLDSDQLRKEMQRALERGERGEACVVPILLYPVDFSGTMLDRFCVLPLDRKARIRPVTRWARRDEAWFQVTKEIEMLIRSVTQKGRASGSHNI